MSTSIKIVLAVAGIVALCTSSPGETKEPKQPETKSATPAAAPSAIVATAKKEVLVQSDHSWDGTKYTHYPSGAPELTMLKITIAPHSALPWHTHPFPNAGYILSGDLTIQDKASGRSVTYHAGQAFAESVDRVHRGESGDAPVVLLVTYSGTPGIPTSKPVRGEKREY